MDKNSYALGMSIAHNMIQSGVREVSFDDFVAGLKATLEGSEPAISYEEAGKLLDKYFKELEERQATMAAELGEAMKKEGEEYLAAKEKEEGVVKTKSGLLYKVLKEGNSRKPSINSQVRCHYEGTFTDGRIFDSSYKRNEPAVFGVNQVIPGWTEALQMMGEGSELELYIPYQLAYGEAGIQGAIPPFSTLIFKVQLLEIL